MSGSKFTMADYYRHWVAKGYSAEYSYRAARWTWLDLHGYDGDSMALASDCGATC